MPRSSPRSRSAFQVPNLRRAIAFVVAAACAAAFAITAATPAGAVTTQRASCVDGGGVRWSAKAIWGSTYSSGGVTKVAIDYVGWTTNRAGALPTDSWVRSYDGTGERLRTLSWTGAFDYASGTAYKSSNPRNPTSAPGAAKVTLTLGVDGDGHGNCTMTFTQPGASAPPAENSPSPTSTPTSTHTPTAAATATATTTTPTSTATATSASTPPSGEWPDASNTGVPDGVTLTNYTGPSKITTPGTVIDGKKVTSCLVIEANDVTIKNSLLQSDRCFFNVLSDNRNTGLKLTDVEIDGLNNRAGDSAVNGDNFTCTRCDIHGTVDGFKAGSNTIIQYSWIHDLAMSADSHNDGIQSLDTTSLKILHNRIIAPAGSTSAIILSTGSASDMRNILIDNNLLGGGAYTVYGGYLAGRDQLSKVSNISIKNNRFTKVIYPKAGVYGPLTSIDPPVVVSGNVWHDGPLAGQPV